MRILYLDDAERFRDAVVQEFLKEHEVVVAATLAQARRLLESQQFDAVLLDFDLPDGKGIELMPELQRRGLSGRTVGVSAFDENNTLMVAQGAFAGLSKMRIAGIGAILRQMESDARSGET